MNYYEILEVSPNASAPVIRAAYKSLMQRYHPDKNPGDVAVASRASLVVQAYEVLSDSDKRAAYDLALRQQAARLRGRRSDGRASAPVGKAADRGHRTFWLLCLVVMLIVLSGWSINSLLRTKPIRETELPGMLSVSPEVGVTGRQEAKRSSDAGRILVLVSRLAVVLKDPGQFSGSDGRVLSIPVLAVKVGARDVEYAVRHLENTQDQIRQKLQENLAEAKFEELIKADGEHYLAMIILNAIGEVFGTDKSLIASSADADSPGSYGVVEILLPESYSVR